MARRLLYIAVLTILPFHLLFADAWYESYEKGLEAIRQEQWQRAVGFMNDAIDDKPDSRANAKTYGLQFIDYFPYLYRGIAYAKLGNRAKALADLERAEKDGAVQNARKDNDAQRLLREYLDQVRKPVTPQSDPKFAEGMRLFRLKDYRGAIDQFKDVPESSSQYKDAVRQSGIAQEELKKLEAASAASDKKEKIDKAYALGEQYLKQNDLARAEEQFAAVLKLDETRADARRNLDRIKTLREKASQAPASTPRETARVAGRESPSTALKPGPDTTKAVLLRDGAALLSAGMVVQAKTKFTSLKALDPTYPGLERYLQTVGSIEESTRKGITAFFEGEYQQAIEQLNETSKGGSDNPHLYAFLACSYAAKYLLAGAEDKALKQHAVEAFAKLKKVDARYALEGKFISPGIISLLTGQ
jgi:hypothetical protein